MLRLGYLIFILACAGAVGLLQLLLRDPAESPRYVGSSSCRSCHDTRSAGKIYSQWSRSPHADAYSALSSDSAVEYMQANDVTIDNCLPCHSTLGRHGVDSIETLALHEGVGCESCHGPGSAYLSATTMIDHSSFERLGGSSGTLRDCYRCHLDASHDQVSDLRPDKPCPFDDATFSADSAWIRLDHARPDSVRRTNDQQSEQ